MQKNYIRNTYLTFGKQRTHFQCKLHPIRAGAAFTSHAVIVLSAFHEPEEITIALMLYTEHETSKKPEDINILLNI